MSASAQTHEPINICGLLVHARLRDITQVKDRLLQYNGVEVHSVTEDGRLVVTIDNDDQYDLIQTINAINSVDGVISAAMVYQHHE